MHLISIWTFKKLTPARVKFIRLTLIDIFFKYVYFRFYFSSLKFTKYYPFSQGGSSRREQNEGPKGAGMRTLFYCPWHLWVQKGQTNYILPLVPTTFPKFGAKREKQPLRWLELYKPPITVKQFQTSYDRVSLLNISKVGFHKNYIIYLKNGEKDHWSTSI